MTELAMALLLMVNWLEINISERKLIKFVSQLNQESNEAVWKLFTEKKIPVEICLTSNVLCKTAASYEDHHIVRLINIDHPIMICVSNLHVYYPKKKPL